MKQKQTQSPRKQNCACQGERQWGGMDWSLALVDANYHTQNGLITGNYIQYPVVNHNGKECIYMYK